MFYFLATFCALTSASVVGRSTPLPPDNNLTSIAISSQSNLSEPIDTRLSVIQQLGVKTITEISAYMIVTQALTTLAFERWTGTAEKEKAWGNPEYPDVLVAQRFKNPVQRRILFLALLKILYGLATDQEFFESHNEILWTGRELGFIVSKQRSQTQLVNGNSTSLDLLKDSNNNHGVIVDRTRGTLSHPEVYTCISSALLLAAQERRELPYTPFATFPDDWDVSITIEDYPAPHRRPLLWQDVTWALYTIADLVSREKEGGKFAQLYGRIKLDGETLANWKLQRGKPGANSNTSTLGVVQMEGAGYVLLPAGGNITVATS